jgi:3-oxoacyl-[acyl-carrier-protein] synthase II
VSTPRVLVRTLGAVSAAGTGLRPLERALADPGWRPTLGLDRPDAPPLPVATCPEFSTAGVLPPLVARRLDRPARLLAVAAREALAAVADTPPWPRERIGVCAGTWNAGTAALLEVLRAVFETSPEEAPPAQFPSTVANAPASQLGILEKLGGPNLTFAEKQVGGLRALAEGARLLRRGRADAVLAGGVDEGNWVNAEGYERLRALRGRGRAGMILAEGAAVLLLVADAEPRAGVELAGWGAASTPAPPFLYPEDPGGLATACRLALERAGRRPEDVDLVASAANGIPALAELERAALELVLGSHRPAALGLAERLGEGAAGGALRALIAARLLGGGAIPAWGAPEELARAGFPGLVSRPRCALVTGVAGGGSAAALVLSAV